MCVCALVILFFRVWHSVVGTVRRVKLAVHEATGEECAIKVMDKSKIHASAMTLHVRREIAIMKTLKHPYVIRLHAVLNSSSKLYLVMDLVKGGELFHKIVREGYLSEAEGRKHFQQLVDGVSYCHSMDVCHRDLKVRAPICAGWGGGRPGFRGEGGVWLANPFWLAPRVACARELWLRQRANFRSLLSFVLFSFHFVLLV